MPALSVAVPLDELDWTDPLLCFLPTLVNLLLVALSGNPAGDAGGGLDV